MSVASGLRNSAAERSCAASAGESLATRSSSGALEAPPSEGSVSVATTTAAIQATGTSGCTASTAHAYVRASRPGAPRWLMPAESPRGAWGKRSALRRRGPRQRALTLKAPRMNGCTRQKYV